MLVEPAALLSRTCSLTDVWASTRKISSTISRVVNPAISRSVLNPLSSPAVWCRTVTNASSALFVRRDSERRLTPGVTRVTNADFLLLSGARSILVV